MKRKLTEEQCGQVISMYQEGMTLTDIAKAFEVNRITIARVLHKRHIVTSSVKSVAATPDIRHIAYVAGLFDGEGSVNIFKQPHRKGMVYPAYFVEISISNTHRGVLQWVLEHFGGRLAHNAEQHTERNHRTWRWRASSDEAYKVLVLILPYLIVKKEQAQLAIEFRERQVAFKGHHQNPMTREESEWRESQKIKLATMRFWKEDEP